MMKRIIVYALPALLFAGCQTKNATEAERFDASVRKELPFAIDSLCWLDGVDMATYRFACRDYVATAPDAFIGPDGELNVYKTTILEKPIRQAEDMIWRNVVVSKKNQRIICIDRYLSEARTTGFVYVLQSESKRFRTLGPYHWDVSDSHNIEMAGGILEHLRQLTLRRMKNDGRYTVPASQNDYWTLIFHADSLMDDGLYAEAKQAYDLAFTEDRYILPSHLSTVAKKMMGIHKDETALDYLSHRVKMEQDFYEEPLHSTFPQLRDTFEVRQHKWGYDLAQKQYLEWIFERDQYNRMLWFLASSKRTESPERIEKLARRAMDTDSTNLQLVSRILSETGYPRKSKVGDFASQTVWMIIQHSDLGRIKQFLPQLEEAVRRGDLAPAYVAATKDRIDIREGRPQKYGTQFNAPLLDASRVNEWRKEVGLPPMEVMNKRE